MPDGAIAPADESLIGDRLELFLDQLVHAGLAIGPRDRINAAALVADLVARGAVTDFAALRPWLAPLLARSVGERERFIQVFDLFDPRPVPASHGNRLAEAPPPPEVPPGFWLALGLVALIIITVLAWLFWPASPKPPDPPRPNTIESAETAPPKPLEAEPIPSSKFEVLNRVKEAAERFEGAPTLEELGNALAPDSPIKWSAAAYAIRASELSGLPRTVPLALYGADGRDGRIWAMIALTVERIERPGGQQLTFAELLKAANEALRKAEAPQPVYDLARRLSKLVPNSEVLPKNDKRVAVRALQDAEYSRRAGQTTPARTADLIDEFTVQRALAIAPDPKYRRLFPDTPWMPANAPTSAPNWPAYAAAAIPLILALFWFANSLAIRKAYLRRRPPDLPPLHLDLISEAATRVRYSSGLFQRIAQKLRQRTSVPTERLDIDASIAATVAGGGEMPAPVYEVSRPTPEYLVLIERQSATDQDAERLRELVRRLESMVPFTVYFYRGEPSRLEPEYGGRSVAIEYLQATYPQHRLLVLGAGAEFLDPATFKPLPSLAKLTHWSQRALLTPLPLAEWGREEFALAHELEMPLGRATPDGLLSLAGMLGLDGAEPDALMDTSGDGRARPLPEILRLRPQRFFYSTPPSGIPVPQVVQHLRNFLDGRGFEWLCALAIYPSIQWDLTLYLGVELPARPAGDAAKAPLYSEERIAALTQLPWLREGLMPNWLRAALIAELAPQRAREIRSALMRLVDAAQFSRDVRRDDAVKLRISREPAKDRLPPDELLEDEILLDFLARGRIEDFVLPKANWLERFIPRGWLDRIGIPELISGLVAAAYAAAALWLSPKPDDGALLTGAWLPVVALFFGGGIVLAATFPNAAYRGARTVFLRAAPFAIAFAALMATIWLAYRWPLDPLFVLRLPFLVNWIPTLPVIGIPTLVLPMAALAWLYLARRLSARLGLPVFAAHGLALRRAARFIIRAASLLTIALVSREIIEGLGLENGDLSTNGYGITAALGAAIFLMAWLFARVLPEQLPPPTPLPRGARPNWGLGALRVAMALAPILPAALLAAYIAATSVKLPDIPGGITASAELPGGSLIALGGADGRVRIIDMQSSSPLPLHEIPTGDSPISDLALRAENDGDALSPILLAASTADGRVHLFDAKGRSRLMPEPLADQRGEASKVHVALGPGRLLLAALETAAGQVRLVVPGTSMPVPEGGVVTALTEVEAGLFAYATLDGWLHLTRTWAGGIAVVAGGGDTPLKLPGRVRRLRYDPAVRALTALGDDGTLLTVKIADGQFDTATVQRSVLAHLRLGAAVKWNSRVLPRANRTLSPAEIAALNPQDVFQECTGCPQMVVVPAGRFMMGSPDDEPGRITSEDPAHPVTISRPFAVGRFEVTFEEWEACVADGGCAANTSPSDSGWGKGSRPVINVSWDDAQVYVSWLSGKTGASYRLLSDAEWEYAARADGPVNRAGFGTAYSWGDEIGTGNANCNGCGSQWDSKSTAPAGSFKPNAFGLYDMHGNAWEWVEDCWNGNSDGAPSNGSAWTTGECGLRVLRGGSWINNPQILRAAYRIRNSPDNRYSVAGFRVSRTLNP